MSVRAVGFGDGGNRNLFMDNSWRYYSFDIVKSGDLNASRSVHYLTMLIPEYTDINIVVWIDRLKVQVIGVSPVQSGDCCIDANGDPIDSAMSITQDSHSFLNTGTELEAYDYPALKQADKDDDFWNEDDGLGTVTPKPVQFDSLITQKGLSDKLFLDSSISETIKNVRMYGNNLKGRQLNTENKLTNN